MWNPQDLPSTPFPKDFFLLMPFNAPAVFSRNFQDAPLRQYSPDQIPACTKLPFTDDDILRRSIELRYQNPEFADTILNKPRHWVDLYNYFDSQTIYDEGPAFLIFVIGQMAVQSAGKKLHIEETVKAWAERNVQKLVHGHKTGSLLKIVSTSPDNEYFDWKQMREHEQNFILSCLIMQAERYCQLPYSSSDARVIGKELFEDTMRQLLLAPRGVSSSMQHATPAPSFRATQAVQVHRPVYVRQSTQHDRGDVAARFVKSDLYIGNLNYDFDPEEVYNMLSTCGKITSYRAAHQYFCAFVSFEMKEHAQEAIRRFNGFMYNDRCLKVDTALNRRYSSGQNSSKASYATFSPSTEQQQHREEDFSFQPFALASQTMTSQQPKTQTPVVALPLRADKTAPTTELLATSHAAPESDTRYAVENYPSSGKEYQQLTFQITAGIQEETMVPRRRQSGHASRKKSKRHGASKSSSQSQDYSPATTPTKTLISNNSKSNASESNDISNLNAAQLSTLPKVNDTEEKAGSPSSAPDRSGCSNQKTSTCANPASDDSSLKVNDGLKTTPPTNFCVAPVVNGNSNNSPISIQEAVSHRKSQSCTSTLSNKSRSPSVSPARTDTASNTEEDGRSRLRSKPWSKTKMKDSTVFQEQNDLVKVPVLDYFDSSQWPPLGGVKRQHSEATDLPTNQTSVPISSDRKPLELRRDSMASLLCQQSSKTVSGVPTSRRNSAASVQTNGGGGTVTTISLSPGTKAWPLVKKWKGKLVA